MSKWLSVVGTGPKRYESVPLQSANTNDVKSYQSNDSVAVITPAAKEFEQESNEIPVFTIFNWNNLMFNWYEKQIVLGEARKIKKTDLLPLSEHLKSKEVFETFKQCWALEALKLSVSGSGFSKTSTVGHRVQLQLWKVFHSLIFQEFWACGLCRLVADMMVVLGSVWIKLLVGAVERRDTKMALLYAFAMLINSLIQTFALQQFIHGSFMSGSRVVTAATSVVFHSTLCLRMHKMSPPKSIGEINNVQSKDANSLRDFVVFFHNLWACPLQILACVGLLIYMLGAAGLVSAVLLGCLVPIERAIGHRARAARKAVTRLSDERMKAINEMIDGIWTIKLTALVPYIYEKITLLREEELASAWHGFLIEMVNKVITRSAPLIITLLTFLLYSIMPGATPLTSDRAFASLALISVLGRPMQVLPLCVSMLVDARVSVERIESIIREALVYEPNLFMPEVHADDRLPDAINDDKSASSGIGASLPSSFSPENKASLVASQRRLIAAIEKEERKKNDQLMASALKQQGEGATIPPCKVIMRAVTATRGSVPKEVEVLKDITFDVTQPGLVIITGGNASGKTSLLLSILNELTFRQGVAVITGPPRQNITVAYSAHEPWIINATARENILLASAGNRHVNDDDDDDDELEALQEEYNARLNRGYQGVNADLSMKNQQRLEAKRLQLESRYQQAVQSCALVQDFNDWSEGDQVLIGERGITVSGGQRQRLSLARALVSDAQVLLLDTPLSGLDVIVGRHVFNKAILEASQTRLVIMTDCTFQAHVLSQASRILACEEGKIIFDGSYGEVVASNVLPALTKASLAHDSNSTLPSLAAPAKSNDDKGNNNKDGGGLVLRQEQPTVIATTVPLGEGKKKTDDLTDQSRTLQSYVEYFKCCGLWNLLAAVTLSFAAYGLGAAGDFQLAYWTDGKITTFQFLVLYFLLSLLVIGANYGRYFMYSYSGIIGSKVLHNELVCSILGSTFFPFFSTTPSGRIASRFSVDFDCIDFNIPSGVSNQLDAFLGIITGVGVVMVSSPLYVFFVVPLAWKYLQVQHRYRQISTELKKIDSATKSPMFSHFKEVLFGLETIRAYGIEERVKREHHQLLDDSICARLNWDFANRWMGIRLDMIGSLIVSASGFLVAFSTLYVSSSGGHAGLMLSYALKATQSLSFAIRASAALENMFTSPDRVREYIGVEQETDIADRQSLSFGSSSSPSDINGTLHIPTPKLHIEYNGGIYAQPNVLTHGPILTGESITARYAPDLPPALLRVSFALHPGKLVGLCGRTGSGKSSMTMVLSRAMTSFEEGRMFLYGKVHTEISLAEYRRAVQVFPQSSFIFSGPIRRYLDPKNKFPDRKLHQILSDLSAALETERKEEIDSTIVDSGKGQEVGQGQQLSLNLIVTSGGNNLSAGQKQVVALARAALTDAKVVILDEITSNMDTTAAERAMLIVKRELISNGAAVLLIAHSMTDIGLCDEVWVMDQGEIIEKGAPKELLRNGNSVFAFMSNVK